MGTIIVVSTRTRWENARERGMWTTTQKTRKCLCNSLV